MNKRLRHLLTALTGALALNAAAPSFAHADDLLARIDAAKGGG